MKQSAGILLHRDGAAGVEVLLGHLGGPLWARKDEGGWGIPKGEIEPQEDTSAAARREFAEELGLPVPEGEWVDLGTVRQSSKQVQVWAVRGDLDPAAVVPGTFTMEWPPRSGRSEEFPEVDRVEWFALDVAATKILKGQLPFLDRLRRHLAG